MLTVSHRRRPRSGDLHRLLTQTDDRLLELLLLSAATTQRPSAPSRFGQALLVAVTFSVAVWVVLALLAHEIYALAS
jgi:hypothetical protein